MRRYDRSLRRTAPRQPSLLTRALSAIRRNGGTLLLPGASTPVLGEELVANGTFDTDTGWTKGPGWTIADGVAAHDAGSASYLTQSPALSLAGGKSFSVTYSVTITAGGGVRAEAAGSALGIFRTTSGTYTEIIAPTSSGNFRLYAAIDSVCTFDNISVREILSYAHGNPPLRNYLDSAGTDLLDSVTQVDQPVGLALDSMGVLGPELAGLTTAWHSYGTGISLSGGQMTFTATPAGQFSARGSKLVAGKTYECEFTVASIGGGGITMFVGGGASSATATTPGTYRGVLKASSADGPYLWVISGTVTAVITSCTCREIPGNHATQPTPASKPLLRRGLVNRLLWSGDLSNVAWVKRGTLVMTPDYSQGLTRLSGIDATAVGDTFQMVTSVLPNSRPYTPAVVLAQDPACQVGLLQIANPKSDVIGRWSVDLALLPAAPTLITRDHPAVTVQTEFSGSAAGEGGVHFRKGGGSGTLSILVGGAALFQGTVTAQQILAAGGIPLTTTAPASSERGRYAWQFDGSNDFLQTGITTGNEGWLAAGVTFGGAAGANETVAEAGAPAVTTNKGVWLFRWGHAGANWLEMRVGNGTAVTTKQFSTTPLLGVPRVVEGGWDASNVYVGVDGVVASKARTGDASPSASVLRIGGYQGTANYLNGPMSAIIYTPVLPSAADRALIRRFVGSLQGQTL